MSLPAMVHAFSMKLSRTQIASRILRFVVLSMLLILAMYLTVRIAAAIVYWSGKLYRPGVSTEIWGFFLGFRFDDGVSGTCLLFPSPRKSPSYSVGL